MNISVFVCVYRYAHTCTHARAHTQIHTQTHTQTHSHIHNTYIFSFSIIQSLIQHNCSKCLIVAARDLLYIITNRQNKITFNTPAVEHCVKLYILFRVKVIYSLWTMVKSILSQSTGLQNGQINYLNKIISFVPDLP